MDTIDDHNYTNIQNCQSKLLNNINFNNIVYLIIDNANLSNNIPLQIDEHIKQIIKCIIKNRPTYFILFENVFSKVLLHETTFNSKNLPKVIFLFKKLYKYVYKYNNNKRFFCKKSCKPICTNIVNYIIYILILDDRMHIKEFNYFHNSILCLLDCCLNLLEYNKYSYKISFNDMIQYIY